jgi:hypothetical protein
MVVTVFSLTAMLVVRRREKEFEHSKSIVKTIDDLDEALNSAVKEINKLGALIQAEIDEKYKSMLFLYNLVEDKQKEIAESADSEVISEMMSQYIEKHGDKLRSIAADVPAVAAVAPPKVVPTAPPVKKEGKPTKFVSAKHKQIWEMYDGGQNVADIAKKLDMGQGEVKLILDLIERAS